MNSNTNVLGIGDCNRIVYFKIVTLPDLKTMNDIFILKVLKVIISRPVHTDHTQSNAHEICLIHWQSLIKVSSTSLLSQLMEGVSKNEGKSLYKKGILYQ